MIIERKKELAVLNDLMESQESKFLAVYGRRRVGKTYLISQFFNQENVVYLEVMGLKKGSEQDHKDLFVEQISEKLNESLYDTVATTWPQVFRLLKQELNKVKDKKVVLFIDELPRFCKNTKDLFLEHLGSFWETYVRNKGNMIIVVSGSSAAWMIENVIDETGTLYDRTTDDMELKPFSLQETKSYLKQKGSSLEDKGIAEVYMAIGGIPKYLDYLNKDDSFFTAINRLFFNQSGKLRSEFNKLFKSLYQNKANQYKKLIIDTFSTETTIGKTLEEIFETNKNLMDSKGQTLSKSTLRRIVDDLVASGFILKQSPFKKTKGDGGDLYFLVDNYCIFYIYWVHNNKNISSDDQFWLKQIGTQNWNSWKGLAFESICLTHDKKIKEILQISGINTVIHGWNGSKQIDLVIDRADDCINVCELKFYKDKYSISEEYALEIEDKIKAFKIETGTKKSIIPIMITSYGCVQNEFFKKMIAKQITLLDIMN
jgi:AAA+ ATPase superfamily predicted ATPase